MIIIDPSIKKCRKELSVLYNKKSKLEEEREDIQALPGSELESLICKIDELIEGEYSLAVFTCYAKKQPLLIRVYTGEQIQWVDAFGMSYDRLTLGQKHSLVGLIEGGGKYRFK